MLVRRLAAALIMTTLTLGTTACSITDNVASLDMYAPSDGQQVDLANVKARNFIYLVSDSGAGFLIGSLVNSSMQPREVSIQYQNPETNETATFSYTLDAASKVDFGYNGNPALDVVIPGRPGQTALVFVSEGATENGSMRVPILDGTLAEYRLLLEQLEAQN